MSLPFFFAFDHLPSPGSLAVGDGGFSAWGMEALADHDGRRWARGGLNNNMSIPLTPGTEFTVGARAYRFSSSQNDDNIFEFRDNAQAAMVFVRAKGSTGRFEIVRGSTILATSSFVWQNLETIYVEFHVVIHDSTGEFELRVNGINVASATGQDTNNTASTNAETLVMHGLFQSGAGGTGVDYTDIYVKGTPGGEGDFYGPIIMEPIRPTADVTKEWTRSAGADNYALVDEQYSNSGTDYVETTVAANDDLYTMGDLSASFATILAVVAMTVGNNTDGGGPNINHVLDDGTSESVGASKTLGTGVYRTQATAFMTAPDAGGWTAAKVNSIRMGIRSV